MKIKISKKSIYLLILLVICLGMLIVTPSLAKFASDYTTEEDVVGITLSFNIGISNIEEYEEIVVDANSYEVFNVNVKNSSDATIYYGIWYKMVTPKKITDDITIARLDGTENNTSGSLNSNEDQTVTIIIKNLSSDAIKVNIGVNSSTTSTSDIEYLGGKYLITGTSLEADYYYDNTNSRYVSTRDSSITFTPSTTNFDYTGDVQTFTVPIEGAYKIEAWGASGGSTKLTNYVATGGNGGYVAGTLNLEQSRNLYVYVGGSGEDGTVDGSVGDGILTSGGYNGGGDNQCLDSRSTGGGGATDIRLVSGQWNDFTSLKSRIMVAGAGGGSGIKVDGAPGGLNSGIFADLYGANGTSTTGGAAGTGFTHNSGATAGGFGKGGSGGGYVVGAGGSGYYGGGGGNHISPETSGGGGGGSSYISGYKGSVSAGNSQKFKFAYSNENNKYYLKVYDQFDNLIGSKETGTSLVQNIERTINYIGRDTYDQNFYLGAYIYNLKITLLDGTVVLYYDFTKNTVNDLSGNGYHGTLYNGASLVYDEKRYSLLLDGVDDYMQVPILPSTIDFAGGFTIEVEIIFNNISDYYRIMDFGNGMAVDNIIAYVYQTDNALGFHLVKGAADASLDLQTSSIIKLNGTNYGKDNEVCETGDTDISCSYHYSGKVFKKAKMIAGNASMPTHDGSGTMTGNSGNGYAKISLIVPTIEEDNFEVWYGENLKKSDITCVDNGSGCKVVRINPGDTSTLSVGTHDINIMVIDDYGYVYQYVKSIVVEVGEVIEEVETGEEVDNPVGGTTGT